MRVRGIDPRDISWEVELPTFRVYFWSQLPAGESHEFRARQCDEYEIADADVYDVLAWAEERTAGSQWTYVVYVVLEDPDEGRGMAKLAGQDPNDPSEPHASWMVQRPASQVTCRGAAGAARAGDPAPRHSRCV